MSQPATLKKKHLQFRVTAPPIYAQSWPTPKPRMHGPKGESPTELFLDYKARRSLRAALAVAIADKQRVAMFEQRVKEWRSLKYILKAWRKQ